MDYESGKAIPNNQVLSKIERALGEYCLFSLSHNQKINLNLLTIKTTIFKYDRRLNNKQFLQVSGLCGAPFESYLLKCSTRIYKAQYGDAMFVLL